MMKHAEAVARYATVVLSFVFVAAYVAVALSRLAFPFDLEWMEGAMVDHVRRVLAGDKIYVEPSLSFVPYLYPPLYYYVAASVALVTGIGALPLRCVSFVCSLGCFVVLYLLVRKETGRWEPGVFAATYRIGGAWFDLARVDSLFLVLFLAAAHLLRHGGSTWAWAAAGVLIALSALTKQTALIMAPALAVYAVVADRRRALYFAISSVGVFAIATLVFELLHGGWYTYYVFGLPARIQDVFAERPSFWRRDVWAAMPVASAAAAVYLAICVVRRHAVVGFYAAFFVATVGGSWLARSHSGAYENVLIPAYACLAVLMALAVHEVPRLAREAWKPQVGLLMCVLAGVQLVALRYDVRAQMPSAHDRVLQRRLLNLMARSQGELWLTDHGFFPALAGQPSHAHSWAVTDIMRAGGAKERERLSHEIHEALRRRRFALIVVDRAQPWLEPDLNRYYHRVKRVFKMSEPGLWAKAGYRTRPRWVYAPNPP